MNELMPETQIEHIVSLGAALKALAILAAGWISATLASRLFMRLTEYELSPHHQIIFSRLIFYILFGLFIITAIVQLGFDISVLLGAASIFTVAIGFASQTSASNFISGLFLLGEKPFEVGDALRVDGDTGEVMSIDLLSIKLRTYDNLLLRIPNEVLIKSKFINLTRFPIRRIDLLVGVAYRENLDKVIALLLGIATNELRCLEEPQPFCRVTNFGSSSVDLQLSVWASKDVIWVLKSDLLKEIKSVFDSNDIEIPFPHVSLYSGSKTQPIPIRQFPDDSNDS